MKKVLLFTMEGNADGEAALAFFQSRGAAVDVRDVGRDPDASAEVFRLAGRLAVPAIVIDERVFLGFGGAPRRDRGAGARVGFCYTRLCRSRKLPGHAGVAQWQSN